MGKKSTRRYKTTTIHERRRNGDDSDDNHQDYDHVHQGMDWTEYEKKTDEKDFNVTKDFQAYNRTNAYKETLQKRAKAQLLDLTFKTRNMIINDPEMKEVHSSFKVKKGEFSLTHKGNRTTVKYWKFGRPHTVTILLTRTHGVPHPDGNRKARRAHLQNSWAHRNPDEEIGDVSELFARLDLENNGGDIPAQDPLVNLLLLAGDVEQNPGPPQSAPSKFWDKCGKCGSAFKNKKCTNESCGKHKTNAGKGARGQAGPKGGRAAGRKAAVSSNIKTEIASLKGQQDALKEKESELRDMASSSTPPNDEQNPNFIIETGTPPEPNVRSGPEERYVPVSFSHTPHSEVDITYALAKPRWLLGYQLAFSAIMVILLPEGWVSAFLLLTEWNLPLPDAARLIAKLLMIYGLYCFSIRVANYKALFVVRYKRKRFINRVENDEVRMERHHHTEAIYRDIGQVEYEVHDDIYYDGYYLSDVFPRATRRKVRMNASYELFTQLMPTVVITSDFLNTRLRIEREVQRIASINIHRGQASQLGLIQDTSRLVVAYALHLRDCQFVDEHLN